MFKRMLRCFASLCLLSLLVFAFGCYRPYKLVMVMDFENSTSDPRLAKLESAIPEYLMTHMSGYEGIRFIERQDAGQLIQAYGLVQDPAFINRSRWKQLGQRIGADYLIAGSVSKLGDNFIIVARLFSVEKGIVVPGSATDQKCRSEEDIYLKTQVIAKRMKEQIVRRSPLTFSGGPYEREGAAVHPAVSATAAGGGP